jgi:hypothetical protein
MTAWKSGPICLHFCGFLHWVIIWVPSLFILHMTLFPCHWLDCIFIDIVFSACAYIQAPLIGWLVGFMVPNATFNNISVISWRSFLVVEETGVPGENHRPVASHWQTLSYNVVQPALSGIRNHNISSIKSNYHMIMAMTAPYSMHVSI